MMSLATNPFFGAMDHPTAPFIAFMVLQIAFLGGGLILGCGSCARNDKFVHANWVLFVVNAVNYAIYAVVFGASANYGGMVAAAALASATGIGALLCRRYAITLTRMQLPTTSPSFYQSEKLYV
ncbi:TPA: hypothetical protein N0F65_010642 [Lagenidium giganteum]|uniref:Polysaccharide biosynthesis protein C-terminal domain-containing protein n=1 Tax=Lagenidium giganteum TaxID=4803 RepID=A0AAV2ZFX6_9STRA|nr:TPA: hypothetical protein N0F65_010642 [Lagenidium giganteum]